MFPKQRLNVRVRLRPRNPAHDVYSSVDPQRPLHQQLDHPMHTRKETIEECCAVRRMTASGAAATGKKRVSYLSKAVPDVYEEGHD